MRGGRALLVVAAGLALGGCTSGPTLEDRIGAQIGAICDSNPNEGIDATCVKDGRILYCTMTRGWDPVRKQGFEVAGCFTPGAGASNAER